MKPHWPVDMRWQITQPFGVNVENYKKRNGHPGIDFGTPKRSPWYATHDGDIEAAAYRKAGGYGREIFLKVMNRWRVVYGHADELVVRVGEHVKRGQLIGYSGGGLDDPYRGNSTGEHTHFEVRDLTKPQTYPLIGAVDPEKWLATDLEIPSSDVNSVENHTNIPPNTETGLEMAHSESGGILTVITDYINVRRDPSTNQPPIGKVLYGMDLHATGKVQGNWREVLFWVHDGNGEYLE